MLKSHDTQPSKNEDARHYDAVYKYRLLVMIDSQATEITVCKKAFMSIHGVTTKKIEYLVASLKKTGMAPVDKRGKHGTHLKLDDEI